MRLRLPESIVTDDTSEKNSTRRRSATALVPMATSGPEDRPATRRCDQAPSGKAYQDRRAPQLHSIRELVCSYNRQDCLTVRHGRAQRNFTGGTSPAPHDPEVLS